MVGHLLHGGEFLSMQREVAGLQTQICAIISLTVYKVDVKYRQQIFVCSTDGVELGVFDVHICCPPIPERERFTSSPTFLGGNTPATLG